MEISQGQFQSYNKALEQNKIPVYATYAIANKLFVVTRYVNPHVSL